MEEFKDRLKRLIDESGMTKYQLSKATEITQTTFSNYLNGVTKPAKSKIKVMANFFGVDPYWLQYGEEKPEGPSKKTFKNIVIGKHAQQIKSTGTIHKLTSHESGVKSKDSDENTTLYKQQIEHLLNENERLMQENERQRYEIKRLSDELFDAKNKIISLLENRIKP